VDVTAAQIYIADALRSAKAILRIRRSFLSPVNREDLDLGRLVPSRDRCCQQLYTVETSRPIVSAVLR